MRILLFSLILLVLSSSGYLSAMSREDDHSFIGLHSVGGGVDGLDLWAIGLYGEVQRIGIRFIFERDMSSIHVRNDRINGSVYDYTTHGISTLATDLFWIFPGNAFHVFTGGGLGFTYHQHPTLFGGTYYSLRGTYGLGYITKDGMRITIESTHSIPAKLLTHYHGFYHGLRWSFTYGI